MALYSRSPSFRRRQEQRERENAWIVPTHGGYKPVAADPGWLAAR